jgi:hypothetical protein
MQTHTQETDRRSSAVTYSGDSRCLIPFDRREGMTTAEAAEQANRTERTIRMWCRDHDIGRRVAGGPWLVSRVALSMLLNDDLPTLRRYLSGDRASPAITARYVEAGLGDLVDRWQTQAA